MLKQLAKIVPIILLSALSISIEAQNFSRHNWFFGNSADAIIFNKSDDQPTLLSIQGIPYGNGGSAVASNPLSGEVLFYTDGLSVYDASHNIMLNGTGLNGISLANQQVGICPVPTTQDQYYIFTNSANLTNPGNLEYSIVDMTLAGNAGLFAPPLGSVLNLSKNVATGISNISEGMVVIPNPSLTSCWVVTHEQGTAIYQVFEVSAGGFGNIQTFNLGAQGASPLVAANFSYTPMDGGKIAVAPVTANRNVQILDFNAATGAISFREEVANTGNNDGGDYEVYDTEWSGNGMNLYISRYGQDATASGEVLQYDPAAPNVQTVVSNLTRSLGLRLGPDGRIYHLYEANASQFLLGRIDRPNQVIDSIGYDPSPPDLGNVNFNGRQFPEFSFARETSNFSAFMVEGLCTNNPTRFYPNVDPTAERFSWNLGGNPADLLAPVVTFSNPGPVTVTLRYFINGQEFTYDSTINISQTNMMVQLQDTIICPGDMVTLDGTDQSMEATSYVWQDKSTSPMLTTDTAGIYWVVATNAQGCTSYSSAEVTVCGEENMRSAVWYFGQNAGIDFNDPQRAISGPMDTPEGTATISDRNGNVLFYTDGESVWNREHNVMPNGTNIGGNQQSTQAALIVPFPGDETLYYVFTTEEIFDNSGNDSYKMGYAVVDIKLDMGLGDVPIKGKPLFERSTERVAAFTGADSTWVVGHEYGTNTFRAYPVGVTGIGNPVLSSIGAVHSIGNAADGEGYMTFNATGDRLAVAVEGQNAVEIFHFSDSTGTLDSLIRVDLNEAPYGLAFSANHLFVTTMNPSKLYRIKMDTTAAAIENTPPLEVFNSSVPLGAIQQSPTGQLFVARQGESSLGTILGADGPDNQVGFTENGFGLVGGTTSQLGLPNFVQNLATPASGPSMLVTGFCLEDPTVFEGTGPCESLDNYEWSVKPQGVDSAVFISFDQNTEFTFQNPGFYDVELRVHNCNFAFDTTMFQTIEISGKPILDSIPGFVPLCNGSATVSAASVDTVGLSFLWSTGDTTNTITITQAGAYSVTVTNPAGCSDGTSFLANPVNPMVDLGFDRIYCLNDPADSLNAGNPNSSIVWTVTRDGTLISTATDTTRIYDVVTDVPGNYLYIVDVTDNTTLCTTSDSVNIEVLVPPSLTATPNDSPGCGQPDGSIDVDILSAGSFTVDVTNGTTTVSDTSSGPGSITIPNLAAGVYSVTLTDNVTQCTETIDGITLQDLGAMFLAGQQIIPTSCDFDDGIVRVFFSDVSAFAIDYILRDQADNSIVSSGNVPTFSTFSGGPGFEITGLVPGMYSVEVTSNANGCTQSLSNLEVDVNADNIDLQTPEFVDGCGNIANILVVTSGDFNVTGPGNVTVGSTTATVDAAGIYTVTATDPNGLLCDSIRTVEVNLAENILLQIDTTAQDCSGSRILTATVVNSDPMLTYTYQWYSGTINGGTRISGALTPAISISEPGTYSVQVGTNENACISEATIADVPVRQPVVVELEAVADCENSASITITAIVNQSNVELIWFDPAGIEIPNTRNAGAINVNERGNFSVLASNVVDGVSCSDLESINLFDVCPPQVFAHNAIRPNSDIAENRNFYIHNPNDVSDNFQVYIFNRWGEMVFQSTDKNFVWDGTYKGRDVPVGTYPYLIRFSFLDDLEIFEKRGGVVVVR